MIQEIHFLRAFSVIAVLLYHLQVPYFSYGYLGVDIFFVISGYLTPYILKNRDAISYISARFRRIIPELLLIILFSLILFFFLLKPYEYNSFLVSSITAITQTSYLFFANNLGYFDVDAKFQPLIHTWSLGIEFFAYLVVCFTLLVNRFRNPHFFSYVFLSLFIISLIYWENYFNPFSRLFAFYVGYVFGSYKNLEIKHIFKDKLFYLSSITYISIAALSIYQSESFFFLSWPNYESIIFPFLVVFVLLCLRQDIISSKILKKVINFFGDISYSLYLWHWVLIVASFAYLRNSHLSFYEQIIFFCVSVTAATLSNYIFNNYLRKLSPKFYFNLSISLIVLIAFMQSFNFQNNFVPKELKNYKSINHMIDKDICSDNIKISEVLFCKNEDSSGVLLIGDSHAFHFYPIFKSNNISPHLIEARFSENKNLDALLKNIDKLIEELSIKTIYISYRFSKLTENQLIILTKRLANIKNIDTKVVFIRDIPSFNWDPISCYFAEYSKISLFKKCKNFKLPNINYSDVANQENPFELIVKDESFASFGFIDTHEKLCIQNECTIEIDGTIIMRDKNHLNEKLPLKIQKDIYKIIFYEH